MSHEEWVRFFEYDLPKALEKVEQDMATLPLKERLLSKDSVLRSRSIEEASKMGEEGAKLLVDLLENASVYVNKREIVNALGETGWVGAVEPIRNILRSLELKSNSDIGGDIRASSFSALARLIGKECAEDIAPYLSVRSTSVRFSAWAVIGRVADLRILEDVWPAWRKGLMQLHRGYRGDISIRDYLYLMLFYWARNARELDPEDLIEVAKGFRKVFPILDKDVTEFDTKFGGEKTAQGGRESRSFYYGYGYWPEILSGDFDDPATLLPSPDEVTRWRKDRHLS